VIEDPSSTVFTQSAGWNSECLLRWGRAGAADRRGHCTRSAAAAGCGPGRSLRAAFLAQHALLRPDAERIAPVVSQAADRRLETLAVVATPLPVLPHPADTSPVRLAASGRGAGTAVSAVAAWTTLAAIVTVLLSSAQLGDLRHTLWTRFASGLLAFLFALTLCQGAARTRTRAGRDAATDPGGAHGGPSSFSGRCLHRHRAKRGAAPAGQRLAVAAAA